MPDLTERLREKLIERIRRIVEDHRPSDHIDDAVCLFRRRGAPSGFRTPDPLITHQRVRPTPEASYTRVKALLARRFGCPRVPVATRRFRLVGRHFRRQTVPTT